MLTSKLYLKQTATLVIVSLLFWGTSNGQIPATISGAGSWSASTGSGSVTFAAGSCYTVTVQAWGGGGGGGGATGGAAAGGGSGGGYAEAVVTVGPGIYYYNIGTGGVAGTPGGNGGNGTNSWFNGTAGTNNNITGAFINGGGGTGGDGASGNAVGATVQTTIGSGTFGTGVTGTISHSGGTGGSAISGGGGGGGAGGGGGGAGSGANGGNGGNGANGSELGGICDVGAGGGGGGGGGSTGAGGNGTVGANTGTGNGGAGGTAGTGGGSAGGIGGNGACGATSGNTVGIGGNGTNGGGGGGGAGDDGVGANGGTYGGGGGGGESANDDRGGGTGGNGYLTIQVSVTSGPTANAGPALAAICEGGTTTIMNGSVSVGATGTWTGGTGTWTNATDPVNATYTGGPGETGTITLTLAATSACGTVTVTKTLTINAAPAAPTVTSPVTYCQNATATALTATGTNLLWYTVATGGVGSATAATPSTAATGSTTYYVSQTVNGCESPRASIVVTVNPTPIATATNTGPYCTGGTITLNSSGGTSYSWSGPNGYTGTGASPAPFSVATYGAGIYTVTVTNANSCTATNSTSVVVNSTPAPTVTSPVTYCQNATATQLTATGTSLLWYTVATGGVGSATAATPSTAATGSTTYYVSQTQNGCESPRASIVVTVNPAPIVTATNTGPYCTSGTITLSGTGGTSYSWSGPNGYTGTGASPAPFSVATYGAGTYTVTVTNANSCTATNSTAVVVNSTVAPTVTSPVTYCQNATATQLTATGTNLLWYAVATGGVGSATAPTPSTAASGSTTYYVGQTQNGCESPRASIVVTVNPTPIATANNTGPFCISGTIMLSATGGTSYSWSGPNGYTGTGASPAPFSVATYGAGTYTVTVTNANSCTATNSTAVVVNSTVAPTVTSPVTYCQNATATQLTATGTNLLWYTVATGGVGSATAPTPSTTASGSTTFYVSQTQNGCESPRASIVVTVNPTPIATANNTGPFCISGTITVSATGGTSYSWSGPNGYTGTGASPAPFSAATYSGGTYTVTVTDANTCTATSNTTVVVNSTLAPTVTSPVTYCQNATAVPLTAAGTNLLWYTVAAGGTGSNTSPTPSTAASGSTTYYVSQTQNGCESPRTSIVVAVNPTPTATASNTGPYCTSGTITVSATGGTSYSWSGPNGYTGTGASPAPFSAATYGDGIYTVTVTDANTCTATANTTVVVNSILTTPISQSICSGQSITFNGQTLSTAGVYNETLTSITGCDSIVMLTLTVIPVTSSVINQSICAGSTYTFNGQALSTADTYYDTLTNAGGCDSIITLNLQVHVTLMSYVSQTICEGTSINFYGQNISAAGLYTDTLTASTGCDSVIYFTLNVTPNPVASFAVEPGDSVVSGTKISLINTSLNTTSEQWLSNNQSITLLSGNILPISETGQYCIMLVVDNAAGCTDTSAPQCIAIYNVPPVPFYMPNAFTPNGDGVNDFIEVYGNKDQFIYLSIRIFDRWGEKVFESADPGFKWDGTYRGTPLPPGEYVYQLIVTPVSGPSVSNKGGITLIR